MKEVMQEKRDGTLKSDFLDKKLISKKQPSLSPSVAGKQGAIKPKQHAAGIKKAKKNNKQKNQFLKKETAKNRK